MVYDAVVSTVVCAALVVIGLLPSAPRPHVDPVFRTNAVAAMCGACVLKLGAFVLCVYPSRAGGGPFLVDSDDETALKLANPEDYGDGPGLRWDPTQWDTSRADISPADRPVPPPSTIRG